MASHKIIVVFSPIASAESMTLVAGLPVQVLLCKGNIIEIVLFRFTKSRKYMHRPPKLALGVPGKISVHCIGGFT